MVPHRLVHMILSLVLSLGICLDAPEGVAGDKIRLGVIGLQPYGWIDESGLAQGAFVKVFQKLSAEAQVDVSIQVYPLPRLWKMLEVGRADCALFAYTDIMKKTLEPVMLFDLRLQAGVIGQADMPLKQYEDLYQPPVAVPRGVIMHPEFDKDQEIKKIRTNGYRHSAVMLQKGRVQAMAGAVDSMLYAARQLGIEAGELGKPLVLGGYPIGFFCRKGYVMPPAEKMRVLAVLNEMKVSHYFRQTVNSYLPQ